MKILKTQAMISSQFLILPIQLVVIEDLYPPIVILNERAE
jgi:hypothetical protein